MSGNKKWFEDLAMGFIQNSPDNRMGENYGDEKMWDRVLVGFASGADPIFDSFKEAGVCGPRHWTPAEIFAKAYPEEKVTPEDLTVVSWILPQTEKSRSDCAKTDKYPAERWSRSRIIGEPINIQLREYMQSSLRQAGYKAISPARHAEYASFDDPNLTYTCNWSERHVAHAAGLGTFGLCDGLITPAGKAHRLGSVVVMANIEPDKRPYTNHHAYCLYFANGTCGLCIKRCPAGAVGEQGHDKKTCRAYLHGDTVKYNKEAYGLEGYGCGMCQTAVPCESGIPKGL